MSEERDTGRAPAEGTSQRDFLGVYMAGADSATMNWFVLSDFSKRIRHMGDGLFSDEIIEKVQFAEKILLTSAYKENVSPHDTAIEVLDQIANRSTFANFKEGAPLAVDAFIKAMKKYKNNTKHPRGEQCASKLSTILHAGNHPDKKDAIIAAFENVKTAKNPQVRETAKNALVFAKQRPPQENQTLKCKCRQ